MFEENNKAVTLLRTLTVAQLVILGLAYMQPLVVLDTFGIVSQITEGHVAGAYLVATLCLTLTAFSYGKLSNRFPSSGSAYTYVKKAMGPRLGFLVGWSSLVDYIFMPMVNMIQAKAYLAAIFPDISPWIFVIILTTVITTVNIVGIKVVANVNTWIVSFQLMVLAVFLVLMIDFIWDNPPVRPNVLADNPQWSTPELGPSRLFSISPFISQNLEVLKLFAGASLVCFSFLGFDSISNFAEETKNPKTSVPRAIMLTVLIAGAIFITTSYLIQVIFPASFPFLNPEDSSQPDIIVFVAGKFIQSVMLSLATFTVLASGIVSQTGVSRLMYVMGRDGVLPKKFFGYLSPRFQTPSRNVMLVGLITLLAGWLSLDFIAAIISFGALVAFTFVNLAVIAQFFVKEKRRNGFKNQWHYLIMPILGALSMLALWYSLEVSSLIFGMAWVVCGIIYLFILTRVFSHNMMSEDDSIEDRDEIIEDALHESFDVLEDAIDEAIEETL